MLFRSVISKKMAAFPSSSYRVKKTVLRSNTLSLTPQESEQLSAYVSNDHYVKKQKEDIEELANLFKEMLDGDENPDRYISELKSHFVPPDDMQAVFQIDLTDENRSLVIEVDNDKLKCYFGMRRKHFFYRQCRNFFQRIKICFRVSRRIISKQNVFIYQITCK